MILLNLKHKAFSLVEVMVVVAILGVGMLAVAALVQQSIKVNNISKSRLTAQELVQEGVELIRWVRDNNFIEAGYEGSDPYWLENIEPGSYRMSFSMDYPEAITSIDQGRLQIVDDGFYEGLFDHNVFYPDSNFYRKIDIESMPGATGNSVRVRATVKWKEGGQEALYSIETILYDWY
ncbi:MAG: prepilin-type N-terminal cleavage/methylation domain-containing protein [Candidatus Pacebacteria bacterium]|nr:prepilin-type N-terminal cleavage/methylation domain-containing protein [Candidatus Paceibacterota bacterium]